MGNFYDFSSDRINVYSLLLDSSGSMCDDVSNGRKGLGLFKESFETFYLKNSIVVSICRFNGDFFPGEFRPVSEMSDYYYADGATALNYAISKSADLLCDYVREVVKRTGIVPRATFVCFSDGEPCRDRMTYEQGREAVARMNYSGIDTAFAAFGKDISAEYGRKQGFKATIDVTNRSALLNFLGVTLPNSCKEQSQSYKSLGADFFSQGIHSRSQSQGYSQRTAQVLEDDDWIDAI